MHILLPIVNLGFLTEPHEGFRGNIQRQAGFHSARVTFLLFSRIGRESSPFYTPTEHLTISDPQNLPIDFSERHKIRLREDFEPLKLKNAQC